MHLALLVPDGVGVRNFVLGPFLALAARRATTTVHHAIPDALLPALATTAGISWMPILPYRETPLIALMRYSLGNAHMFACNTRSMRAVLAQPVKGSWRTRSMRAAAKLVGRGLAHRAGIAALERAHDAAVARVESVAAYRDRLRDASVLFCTHQRPPAIAPVVRAARELGVPTATFIFSWDNLTSKGRIAMPFDHYLVWSEVMREELLHYYPDVRPERVHVVGTPQFDPYADASILEPRERWLRGIGADPRKPLVCYSGGDHGTCPDDPAHVELVLDAVGDRATVLLRPAPVDSGERYRDLRARRPELVYAQPAWKHAVPGDWIQVIPTAADVAFLANLTAHADVNVNMASTMTLDFAIHDRPVVNIAIDVTDPPRFGAPYWNYYYEFDHYRPVVQLGAARVARTRDELSSALAAYLADPSLDAAARRRFVALEIGQPIGAASQTIVERLAAIAR